MPTSALCQSNRPQVSSCRNSRGCTASVCRLQAFPARPTECHRARVHVLVYSCAESADRTSTHNRSQCLDGNVLTPNGGLDSSQAAKDGRPILSGGGGGIFFFWQLGMHLSLRNALECCASLALTSPAAAMLYTMSTIQGLIFMCKVSQPVLAQT